MVVVAVVVVGGGGDAVVVDIGGVFGVFSVSRLVAVVVSVGAGVVTEAVLTTDGSFDCVASVGDTGDVIVAPSVDTCTELVVFVTVGVIVVFSVDI